MNSVAFILLACCTLGAALAAATLPRLIHAALAFAAAFVGVAVFYFSLGAEFGGLAQCFVYVGAVAVLIVFPFLLTRRAGERAAGVNWSGAAIALVVFGVLFWAIARTSAMSIPAPAAPALTVWQIGEVLMSDYVWPLQCVGLLLTAALIGALVLVLEEKR